MKKLLLGLTALVVMVSCKTSKDYLSRMNEDKTISDIVKQLNKHSDDTMALAALPQVYGSLQQKYLNNIDLYNDRPELNKWDRIVSSYQSLQDLYNVISNSAVASKLIDAVTYDKELMAAKEAAAEDYYQAGLAALDKNNRMDAKKAYDYFKRADQWMKDYKDATGKMDEAFNSSMVLVQINPVQENSFFMNASWNSSAFNNNEYFQQNLVCDLGGKYAQSYPAKFYTEWEARSSNVQPDWVVDLALSNIDIPRPVFYNYSRNRSKDVQIGSDTAGKPVYKTVYATLNVQRQSLNARGQMDMKITNTSTRKSILYDTYTDTFNWQQEVATYTGDSRALTSNDLALINNSYNIPRREDIVNELYNGLYPQVKNRISSEVAW